jgi:hypothetical protein
LRSSYPAKLVEDRFALEVNHAVQSVVTGPEILKVIADQIAQAKDVVGFAIEQQSLASLQGVNFMTASASRFFCRRTSIRKFNAR